jgi:lipoate-protein ligase A
MGVDAELIGRNDILVDGKKISGTAQFSTGKRMISHGTLLLDTDLGEVVNALNVKPSKIESKGHKSVRSRVANISEYLKEPLKIEEFRELLLKGLYEQSEPFETYHLTDEEWAKVHKLKKEKYDTWDWNYGRNPKFNIQRTKRFPIGELDLRIFVEKGQIVDFKIFGDFFGKEPVENIENLMIGVRYKIENITEALKDIDTKEYFGDLQKSDFIELIHGVD